MEFKEIERPDVWKPENEGDQIEGKLVSKRQEVGPNKSMLYHLKKKDDSIIGVWGSTMLDSRLQLVNVDDYVRITFKKMDKNQKGQPVKIFKVEVGVE